MVQAAIAVECLLFMNCLLGDRATASEACSNIFYHGKAENEIPTTATHSVVKHRLHHSHLPSIAPVAGTLVIIRGIGVEQLLSPDDHR